MAKERINIRRLSGIVSTEANQNLSEQEKINARENIGLPRPAGPGLSLDVNGNYRLGDHNTTQTDHKYFYITNDDADADFIFRSGFDTLYGSTGDAVQEYSINNNSITDSFYAYTSEYLVDYNRFYFAASEGNTLRAAIFHNISSYKTGYTKEVNSAALLDAHTFDTPFGSSTTGWFNYTIEAPKHNVDPTGGFSLGLRAYTDTAFPQRGRITLDNNKNEIWLFVDPITQTATEATRYLGHTGIRFDWFNLTNTVDMFIADPIGQKGINYDGDYEANFEPRTLVTKQFVTSEINTSLGNYVTLATSQTITGTKTLTGGTFLDTQSGGSGLLANNPHFRLSNLDTDILLSRRGIFTTGGFSSVNQNTIEFMTSWYSRGRAMWFINSGDVIQARREDNNDLIFNVASTGRVTHADAVLSNESVTLQQLNAAISASSPGVGAGITLDGSGNIRFGEYDGISLGENIFNLNQYNTLYSHPASIRWIGETSPTANYSAHFVDLKAGNYFAYNGTYVEDFGTGFSASNTLYVVNDLGGTMQIQMSASTDAPSNYIRVRDTINQRGLENEGDYEVNFVARSLITKQYADNKYIGNITASVPAANNSAGTKGTFAYDSDFIYICIATDSWLRSPRDLSF